MNERQLRYALAVQGEASFSGAAEALRISQPALSEQVRVLEQELGFMLFVRNPRGVTVSERGALFLRHAQDVIQGFSGLSDLARYLRKLPAETISIGLSPWIVQPLLPVVTGALRHALGNTRLSCVAAIAAHLPRMVLQETVHFGILVETGVRLEDPSLTWETLGSTDLVAVAAKHNDAFGSSGTVTIQDLAGERLVAHEFSMNYGAITQNLFLDASVQPMIAGIGDSIEAIKAMVSAGLGVAVLPALTVSRDVREGRLYQYRILPRRSLTVSLVRRSGSLKPNVKDCFRLVKSCLGDTDWGDDPSPVSDQSSVALGRGS
jgi:DNA-binding transcriptional LysR family regulator